MLNAASLSLQAQHWRGYGARINGAYANSARTPFVICDL
jgi:hypothetical protein